MHFSLRYLALILCLGSLNALAQASEFDQYLQEKNIINADYKIINASELNNILALLSAEDSKTLPLQIDQNTIIEQLHLDSQQTRLKGLISTPDFAQFEKDLGKKEVLKLIRNNLIQNCDVFFEHEYQRRNPYLIKLSLRSINNSYELEIKAKDCKF